MKTLLHAFVFTLLVAGITTSASLEASALGKIVTADIICPDGGHAWSTYVYECDGRIVEAYGMTCDGVYWRMLPRTYWFSSYPLYPAPKSAPGEAVFDLDLSQLRSETHLIEFEEGIMLSIAHYYDEMGELVALEGEDLQGERYLMKVQRGEGELDLE